MRVNWKTVLGLAVAAALLWWLFRDIDPGEVWSHIRNADFLLLLVSATIAMGAFAVRAVRWRFFLAPAQPESPFASRFAAVCVGFMANNLLPSGRVGELGRAYAYSRLEPVPVTTAFATLVVERLLDGVTILALLFVAVASPSFPTDTLPEEFVTGIRGVALVLAAVLGASVLLVAFPRASVKVCGRTADRLLPSRLATGLVKVIEGVVQGLASMRGWRHMIPALLWSFGVWILQSLSFWVGFLAFGIHLPFASALLTNAAIAVAVALPAAPGYVGTFQFGASLALVGVYGVEEALAISFALGWHLVNFFPITLAGLWYARRLEISLKDFRGRGRDASEVAAGTAKP